MNAYIIQSRFFPYLCIVYKSHPEYISVRAIVVPIVSIELATYLFFCAGSMSALLTSNDLRFLLELQIWRIDDSS